MWCHRNPYESSSHMAHSLMTCASGNRSPYMVDRSNPHLIDPLIVFPFYLFFFIRIRGHPVVFHIIHIISSGAHGIAISPYLVDRQIPHFHHFQDRPHKPMIGPTLSHSGLGRGLVSPSLSPPITKKNCSSSVFSAHWTREQGKNVTLSSVWRQVGQLRRSPVRGIAAHQFAAPAEDGNREGKELQHNGGATTRRA
ncbi:hypothetical protein JCGZ_12180 [Jatropha curcas]|uniref:Uncharacterized protein n=1 Tax=Jatropha curcas TaxID=180498 RepID=A0A067KCZ6_JATCU|nr:hypothetical protein JCGZ_12180 [Jatropha curcas]